MPTSRRRKNRVQESALPPAKPKVLLLSEVVPPGGIPYPEDLLQEIMLGAAESLTCEACGRSGALVGVGKDPDLLIVRQGGSLGVSIFCFDCRPAGGDFKAHLLEVG